MKKKFTVIITSYAIALFAVMGGFIYSARAEANVYKLRLANTYQHAFGELVTEMGEISSALQKSLYATSPSMISSTCTEIFGKSMSAQMAMGELPFFGYELEQTSSFITKVGDYAYVLSKNSSSGNGYSDEEYENLVSLSKTAALLSDNLNQLYADINDGVLSISELGSAERQAGAADNSTGMLGDSFKMMESEFPEIPSLIYDGPFSSHITQMKPVYLEGQEEIGREQAVKSIADFMNLRSSIFELTGEREGNLPVYLLSAQVDGGTLYAEVSKNGGVVVNMMNSRSVSEGTIKPEDAIKIASRFLSRNGFDDMKESYYTVENGVITINFAYCQDGVMCYTDLIKVKVALDNGGVVGFESLGYTMSHKTRDIPEVQVSEEDARSKVSPHLKILSHRLCVIPTSGKNEIFCHEFKCENSDGTHYIVYVNAETGNEEKILILIESPTGTLAL